MELLEDRRVSERKTRRSEGFFVVLPQTRNPGVRRRVEHPQLGPMHMAVTGE